MRRRRILSVFRSRYNATMAAPNEPLVIYPGKLKALGLLLWCAIIGGGCTRALVNSKTEGWMLIASYLMLGLVLVMCVIGVVQALRRLFPRKPLLVIDHDGITYRDMVFRWEEIHELIRHGPWPRVMLGIMPTNVDALLARAPRGMVRQLRGNLRFHPAPVNIPQFLLPMSVERLLKLIEARFHPDVPVRRMY